MIPYHLDMYLLYSGEQDLLPSRRNPLMFLSTNYRSQQFALLFFFLFLNTMSTINCLSISHTTTSKILQSLASKWDILQRLPFRSTLQSYMLLDLSFDLIFLDLAVNHKTFTSILSSLAVCGTEWQ